MKAARDFTLVSDAVAPTRAAAVSGRPGSVYNGGGGERAELNHLPRLVEGISARPLRIQRETAQRGDMRDTFADTTAPREDPGPEARVGLEAGPAREWERLRGRR